PFFEQGARRAFMLGGQLVLRMPKGMSRDDASWLELREEVEAWFDAVAAQQRIEPWLRTALAPPARPMVQSAIVPRTPNRVWGDDPVSRALEFPGRSERRRDEALRAMLALARWRNAQGTAPTSLSGLVPEFLPSEPIDPRTGQPMTLTVEDRAGGRVWVLRQGDHVVARLPAP
ncbi:MAG: hypothetical protein ACO3DS_10340, partial [Phycisphaerales bacterium]